MRTSMRIRSGLTLGAMSTASSPLEAANTSCPAKRRVNATKSRISRSSSAISILAMYASLFFMHRQGKGEYTAFARYATALHPNAAVMHFHNLFDDGKTQTGSRRRKYQRMFTTIETLEHTLLVFKGNTNAVIFHIHLHLMPAIQGLNLDLDRSIFRRVMVGVIDQVCHDLTHTFHITIHKRQFLRHIQRDAHRLVFFL